jgi:hypothetical protein
VVWHGVLIALAVLVTFVVLYLLIHHFSWGTSPHWIEAHRDRFKLANWIDNSHWFWIHEDTEYWILRLRLDQGPVVIDGPPPDAPYWSLTYYVGNETNPSLNMENIELDENGDFQIVFTKDPESGVPNQIPVAPDVTRAIIEYRVTLLDVDSSVQPPEVTQAGELLIAGGGR